MVDHATTIDYKVDACTGTGSSEAQSTEAETKEDTVRARISLPGPWPLPPRNSPRPPIPARPRGAMVRWMEWCFRVRDPDSLERKGEVTGFGMDVTASGLLNQSGTYLGSAILRLASAEAGCTSAMACTGTLYGLRPSSFLTMSSVAVGLATALTMPPVGAMVDFTSRRKDVAVFSAVVVSVLAGVQIMIGEATWFPSLILEMIGGYVLNMHNTAVLAYLPDLSSNADVLALYTARFNIGRNFFTSIYLAVVSGSSLIAGLGSVATARVGQGVACVASGGLFAYSWIFLFQPRGPLRPLPDDTHLVAAGLRQTARTATNIVAFHATYSSSLRWFMLSLLFSPEAGAGVYGTIAVTFLIVVVQLNAAQVGIVSLVMIVAGMPGSRLSQYFCVRFSGLASFRACLVFFTLTFLLTGVVLSGPDRKWVSFVVAFFWGVAFGWIGPTSRVLYCTLSPRGQDAEIMGFFQFCGQILGWLPPLVFTIMNESGVNMRISMSLTALYPLMSVLCLIPICRGQNPAPHADVRSSDTEEGGQSQEHDNIDWEPNQDPGAPVDGGQQQGGAERN